MSFRRALAIGLSLSLALPQMSWALRPAGLEEAEPSTKADLLQRLGHAPERSPVGLEERIARIGKSRLELVQGDITHQQVDAVVNAANSMFVEGGGVAGAIHGAGGPAIQKDLNRNYPYGILPGEAVLSIGGQLPVKRVIHAVGPVYTTGPEDARLLASAYRTSLEIAVRHGIRSIAFPSLSTGAYGYPVEDAAVIAVQTVAQFLRQHPGRMTVRFALYDNRTLAAYQATLRQELAIPSMLQFELPTATDRPGRRLDALTAVWRVLVWEAPIQFDYVDRQLQGGQGSLDRFMSSYGFWQQPSIAATGLTPLDLQYILTGTRGPVETPTESYLDIMAWAYLVAEVMHTRSREGRPVDDEAIMRDFFARADQLAEHFGTTSVWGARRLTPAQYLAMIQRTREVMHAAAAGLEEGLRLTRRDLLRGLAGIAAELSGLSKALPAVLASAPVELPKAYPLFRQQFIGPPATYLGSHRWYFYNRVMRRTSTLNDADAAQAARYASENLAADEASESPERPEPIQPRQREPVETDAQGAQIQEQPVIEEPAPLPLSTWEQMDVAVGRVGLQRVVAEGETAVGYVFTPRAVFGNRDGGLPGVAGLIRGLQRLGIPVAMVGGTPEERAAVARVLPGLLVVEVTAGPAGPEYRAAVQAAQAQFTQQDPNISAVHVVRAKGDPAALHSFVITIELSELQQQWAMLFAALQVQAEDLGALQDANVAAAHLLWQA